MQSQFVSSIITMYKYSYIYLRKGVDMVMSNGCAIRAHLSTDLLFFCLHTDLIRKT